LEDDVRADVAPRANIACQVYPRYAPPVPRARSRDRVRGVHRGETTPNDKNDDFSRPHASLNDDESLRAR